MPEQLKNIFFTETSIDELGKAIQQVYGDFNIETFTTLVFDDTWGSLELKDKMRHTARRLHATLPPAYRDALEILKKAAPSVTGFEAMCLPDFVEQFGLEPEHKELSLEALGHFTRYASSEFAIRPFLDRDPEGTMTYMRTWAQSESHHVRRLASEGCRPRLPWAPALPKFKKDPSPILPILETLKNDPSETVRRSVANNLNDISKDNPDTTLDTCEKWYGDNKETDAIVKHACRTLLKAGNKRALILFGFADPTHLKVEHFTLDKNMVTIGEDLHFSFDLMVNEKKKTKIRLEYAVYFMKANGKLSKKVFKITENTYAPGKHSYKKKHSFADMSTRKHHPGKHEIAIIINGEEKSKRILGIRKKGVEG